MTDEMLTLETVAGLLQAPAEEVKKPDADGAQTRGPAIEDGSRNESEEPGDNPEYEAKRLL